MNTVYTGIARNVYTGKETVEEFNDIDGCLNWLMLTIYREMGDGDGENGGKGSLWRCADEIYDALKCGHTYAYADMEFTVHEGKLLEDVHKKYVFMYSTILNTNVVVEADTYEDARKRANEWADRQIEMLNDEMTKGVTKTDWDPIGSWSDEGETEL